MRRFLIVVLVLVVAWFAFKNMVFAAMLGTSETVPVEPDYYYEDAWLLRPAEATPGGWESPWGVDLFVIAPPVHSPTPKGLVSIDADALHADFEQYLADTELSAVTPEIYAPAYRSPSPADTGHHRKEDYATAAADAATAFRRYMTADNRDRAFMVMAAPGAEKLLPAVLEAIPEGEEVRLRFGGIVLPETGRTALDARSLGACSPALDDCVLESGIKAEASALRWFVPGLPHPEVSYSAAESDVQAINQRASDLSSWLEDNAVKPAEPFDTWAADEVVDVAPIRRPNQDEDISGERGD